MSLTKLTMVAANLLAVCALGGGGLLSYHALATEPARARPASGAPPAAREKGTLPPLVNRSDDARKIRDKFRSFRPDAKELAIFQLDWAPTLKDAKQKAGQEQRPIVLAVVTNSYGNLFTGHC
jgi:hypothetical protein